MSDKVDLANDPYWGPYLKAAKEKEEKLLSSKWDVGFRDRGMGHGDFAVIVKKTGEVVVECPSHAVAGHIVEVHNAIIKPKRRKSQ